VSSPNWLPDIAGGARPGLHGRWCEVLLCWYLFFKWGL